MADGRHFTDYRSQCQVNAALIALTKIRCGHEQRMFLTSNGSRLMRENRQAACDKNCCTPCQKSKDLDEPLTLKDCENCPMDDVQPSKEFNCCADSGSLFNYYGHATTKAQGELFPRKTIPSGGDAMRGGDPVAYNM